MYNKLEQITQKLVTRERVSSCLMAHQQEAISCEEKLVTWIKPMKLTTNV